MRHVLIAIQIWGTSHIAALVFNTIHLVLIEHYTTLLLSCAAACFHPKTFTVLSDETH